MGHKVTISLLLFLAFALCTYGQPDTLLQVSHKRDLVNDEILQDMRNDDAYAYIIEQSKEEGFIGKIWTQIKEYINSFFRSTKRVTGSNFFSFIIIFFAIGALVYFFLKSQRAGFFQKSRKHIEFVMADGMTIEDTENIPALLSEALRSKEYKKAIQLMYVQSILLLGEADRVDVRKFKTNAAYYDEIKDGTEKGIFRDLTKLFEYIQFGDFEATQQDVDSMQSNLTQLKMKLVAQ